MKLVCLILIIFSLSGARAVPLCERYVCHATGPGPNSGTSHSESYYGNSAENAAQIVVARCERASGGACSFDGCEKWHGPTFNLFGDGCVDAWSAPKH